MVIDNKGNYWIADFSANRIQKLDSSRIFIDSWSVFVDGAGDSMQIIEPAKLAVDNENNIYILSNSSNWEVVKINNQGQLLNHWNVDGNGYKGLAIDSRGRLIVTGGPKALNYYELDGTFIETKVILQSAEQIAIDSDDHIYTYNSLKSEIQVYGSNGDFVNKWIVVAGGEGGDLAISSAGDVFQGTVFPGQLNVFLKR